MSESDYFDTPERAERAQLLVHLVNNTEDVLYLRGPAGSGKTRFVKQLLTDLESDYELTWHTAGEGVSLPNAAAATRPLATGDAELDLLVQEEDQRPPFLIIDDADAFGPEEIESLRHLYRSGERILLLGTGGPVQGLGEMRLQFVDLPPFSEAQSREFIRLQGKLGDGALDEKMVSSLHRAAAGQPGPLLDALAGLPPASQNPAAGKKLPIKGPLIDWKWIALAGVLVLVLGTALIFQDRINAWFVPDGDAESAVTAPEKEREEPADPFRSGIVEVAPVDVQADLRDRVVEDRTQADLPPAVDLPAAEKFPGTAEQTVFAADDSVTEEESMDPILDAVIDAAISAAEQAPPVEPQPALPVDVELPQDRSSKRSGSPGEKTPPEPASVAADTAIAKPKPPEPRRQAGTAQTGQAWLQAQPSGNYTLQLVGSRDRASIDRFIRKHGLSGPYAVFSRDLNGQPWYSLVSGSFPSRDAAISARKRLPQGLSGVWPRTFASIGEQLTGR